jgi:hypothetical protein
MKFTYRLTAFSIKGCEMFDRRVNPAVQACRRMRLPANYLCIHDNVCGWGGGG